MWILNINEETDSKNCDMNLNWGWQSYLLAISSIGVFPQLYMSFWFLTNRMIGSKSKNQTKLDIVQYLKNSFRVPMCLLTIYNAYYDIYAIFICQRYYTLALEEGNDELASKLFSLRLIMILVLQLALVPRYFMIIWTFTFMGEVFPEKWKRFIFKYLLDVEKEEGIKDHSEPAFER